MNETTQYVKSLTLNRKMASLPSVSMATYNSHLPLPSFVMPQLPEFLSLSTHSSQSYTRSIKSSSVAHSIPSCLKKTERRQILTHSVSFRKRFCPRVNSDTNHEVFTSPGGLEGLSLRCFKTTGKEDCTSPGSAM